MNRNEKYTLERKLIELENAVQELVDYADEQNVFIGWFNDPMAQIESWFGTRSNYGRNDKR